MNRHKAYTEMLERHRTMVWRLCLQHSRGDMDRCHDLMQEVTITLWLHFDQLRTDATPQEERAWVRWQCRSALDLLRRKEHLTMHPLPLDAEEKIQQSDDTAAHREDVDDLMATLNTDEQKIMHWQLEGYNAEEIAHLMGIGRNAVYQRVHRAVAKMRRVALLMLVLLAATAVAVAVVPQWRHIFFGGEPMDTTPEDPSPIPVDTVSVDSVAPPAPRPKSKPHPRPKPMEYLQVMTAGAEEELPTIEDIPTVSITGNVLVVSGVYGERVTVYSYNGTLLASQMCNGICTFRILPDGSHFGNNYLRYTIKIGDRPEIFVSL